MSLSGPIASAYVAISASPSGVTDDVQSASSSRTCRTFSSPRSARRFPSSNDCTYTGAPGSFSPAAVSAATSAGSSGFPSAAK